MPLDQIARLVERTPPLDFRIDDLRCRFYNILQSLEWRHVTAALVATRLQTIDAFFFGNPAHTDPAHTITALAASCQAADDFLKESDHYLRGEPISRPISVRAVTFSRNQFGRLGTALLGEKASAEEIKLAFDAQGTLGARPFISPLGAEDRPVWLTPYAGEVELICEELLLESVGPVRRALLIRKIVAKLGLVHVDVGDELLAFITLHPIEELTFHHPANATFVKPKPVWSPVGPTPFEAREHRRFRNWVSPPAPSFGYGRTYDLAAAERAVAVAGNHGAEEAVRPRMAISEFTECLVLGTLKELPDGDTDAAYQSEIKVDADLASVLRRLHRRLGI